MKRRPRVLDARIVLACLLFAVVVSVGSVPLLAWRAGRINLRFAWNSIEMFELDRQPRGPTIIARERLFGYTEWYHAPPAAFHPSAPQPTSVQSDPRPRWAQPVSDPWRDGHKAVSIGFPFRGVRGWHEYPGTAEQVVGRIYLFQDPSAMLMFELRSWNLHIPYVPRWPGLTANTLIFFAIPFVPWTVLRQRRLSRIERLGLCYTCRYEFPREIATCPECGMARPPARGSRA